MPREVRKCSLSSMNSVLGAATRNAAASTFISGPTPKKSSNVLEILRGDALTYARKAADYAPNADPNENFRTAATFAARVCRGFPETDPRRAVATLIGVKISRLMTLGLARDAQNESVKDSLADLRVYAAILEALL